MLIRGHLIIIMLRIVHFDVHILLYCADLIKLILELTIGISHSHRLLRILKQAVDPLVNGLLLVRAAVSSIRVRRVTIVALLTWFASLRQLRRLVHF